MRHRVLVSSISAAICLAGLIPLVATAATANAATANAPASPPVAVQLSRVDLHAGYARFLTKEKKKPKDVNYATGLSRPALTEKASASCAEPHCPLVYEGGTVQHAPKLYLLLWGPSWSPTGTDTAYLDSFLSGLGVEPEDTWSTTTAQYGDTTGQPSFSTSVLQGVYQDTTTPPSGVTQTQLAAEADAFYSAHALTDRVNTQIVVATESGTCPSGFYAPICAGGTGNYCAWHSSSSVYGVPYTNLPYLPDAGADCGQDQVNTSGTYDGFSIVEGHEYAETVTDPYPNSAWVDLNDPSGGEIADKCAWTGLADVTLSTGSYAMQPLWSNGANNCVQSTPLGTTLAIATNSFPSGTVGEAYQATAIASGGTTPYTWSRTSGAKPPGLSFSAGGVWSGTPTGAGTYSFPLQVTDHSGAKVTRDFSIKITVLAIATGSFPSGTVGEAYHATAIASGGTAPYTWSRTSGAKPPGLSFSAGGVWSGTPTGAGTYSFPLQVTDHNGIKTSRALSITIRVLAVATGSFPSGTVGARYKATATASGGTAPYSWSRTSGTKPPGLSFSASGVWSGTPTRAGTYYFSLQVTDHLGKKASKTMRIVVAS
jgi:hypothetical protein